MTENPFEYTTNDYTVIVDDLSGTMVIKRSDGSYIPIDTGNRDYREFLVIDTDDNLCIREHHPTTDEKWASIRSRRDALLAKCDWTQVADAPLTEEQKTAWRNYRQALRDIPQAFATPEDVVWPDSPV